METVKIKAGSIVKLLVEISSEAVVNSLIRLNGEKKRASGLSKFKVDLGLIDNIHNQELSFRSGFDVLIGDFDSIFKNTVVTYTVIFDDGEKSIDGIKVKIIEGTFIALNKIKLLKK